MTKFLTILAAALLTVASSLPAYSQDEIGAGPSAFDMAKINDVYDLTMSPSGRYLAMILPTLDRYCIDSRGQARDLASARCRDSQRQLRVNFRLAIFDLDTDTTLLQAPMPENFSINWLEWANEDRLLIAVERNTTVGSRGFSIGSSRVISFSRIDGSTAELFSEFKARRRGLTNRWLTQITNHLYDDPDHILMPAEENEHLNLYRVNVNDGSATLVEQGTRATTDWYTDSNGVARLRIDCRGRNCRKLEIYSRPQGSDEWVLLRETALEYGESSDDFDFLPVAPTDDPSKFIVLSQEEDEPRASVRIFDIENNEYGETIYEHPIYDVTRVFLDLEGRYAGAGYIADTLEYALVDQQLQRHLKALKAAFGSDANIRFVDFTPDGQRAILSVSTPADPGQYLRYDLEEANISPIAAKKNDLLPFLEGFDTDVLTITARDGLQLTAYHSYPSEGTTSDTPLIILPHGGPEARDILDYDPEVFYYVSHGYQVLRVNFRGSSGYGREFVELGHGEWGRAMQDDVTDAVLHLFEQDKAKPSRTCIVGYSYGGYVALYGAATTPELYSCVVAGGAVTDLVFDLNETRRDFGRDSEIYQYWLKWMGDPTTDRALLQSLSPTRLADQIQAPVLLIHGEFDGIVDIGQARRMRRALNRADVEHEFHILENAGHSRWSIETEAEYYELVRTFLDKHMAE